MKKQELIVILVPSLIFVFAWIGFNIYHSWVTPTISEQQQTSITPINPNFDTKTISLLKQRVRVEPVFINAVQPTTAPLKQITTVDLGPKNLQATTGGKNK